MTTAEHSLTGEHIPVFDGLAKASGTYQFVEDPTLELGGYYTTEYTLSDGLGNSLQFENIEVSWTEYANGKFGIGTG